MASKQTQIQKQTAKPRPAPAAPTDAPTVNTQLAKKWFS